VIGHLSDCININGFCNIPSEAPKSGSKSTRRVLRHSVERPGSLWEASSVSGASGDHIPVAWRAWLHGKLCKTLSSPYCLYCLCSACRVHLAPSHQATCRPQPAPNFVQNALTSQPEAQPPSSFPSVIHARTELTQCYSKRLCRKQKVHRGWMMGFLRVSSFGDSDCTRTTRTRRRVRRNITALNGQL
jgi:hypothetical protein